MVKNQFEHLDYIEQLVKSDSDTCESALQSVVLEKWVLTENSKEIQSWLKEHRTDNSVNSLCLQG